MSGTGWAHSLGTAVLDLLFPPQCVACRRRDCFLCSDCFAQTPLLPQPQCGVCGEPVASGSRCARCAKAPLAVDGILSIYVYTGPVQVAIRALKYHGLKAVADPLGAALVSYLAGSGVTPDVVVPVPLHPRRLRERGYNQSELLARSLGRRVSLPVETRALVRTRDTSAQAKAASAEERRRNVANAFACRGEAITGRKVLLVDDVCTTGATLSACAQALKAAGAARVSALTVAREP